MQEYWLKKTISYIEKNLRTHLELEDVADIANFSITHFHRLFFQATGYTVKEYIRKRRLSLALRELSISNLTIGEISARYGYQSQEALTRAFKKEFGVTPGKLRKAPQNVPFFNEYKFKKYTSESVGFEYLNPCIVSMAEVQLIGLKRRIGPNDPEIMDLVSELHRRYPEIASRVKSDKCYWLCKNATLDKSGNIIRFDTYPSFEILPKYKTPKGWYHNTINKGKYICFTHKGSTDKLYKTYEFIYQQWMPEHNYEPARDEDFELYDSRFIPDSDESLLFIMIPVNELKETKHE